MTSKKRLRRRIRRLEAELRDMYARYFDKADRLRDCEATK